MKITNLRIEIKHEKEIKRFIATVIMILVMYYLDDLKDLVFTFDKRTRVQSRILVLCFYSLMFLVSLFFYRKMSHRKPLLPFGIKDYKQYLLCIPLLAVLIPWNIIGCKMFQPKILDGAWVYNSRNIFNVSVKTLLWCVFYYVIVVGFIEEFAFRICLQEQLEAIMGRLKWLAPVIIGIFFGWVHTIIGTKLQAQLSVGVGIILGYTRMYNKNCSLLTIALAHGLYDLLVTLFL
jgi:membrane protease YdiL (CAAX protease family)